MSTQHVFRSTHPDALAAWQDVQAKRAEVRRKRTELLDELGFAERRQLVNGNRLVGIEHREEHGDIPEGWRRDSKTYGAIVPARRSPTGKKIGKRIDALPTPSLRAALLGGMPEMAWDLENNFICHPGVEQFGDAIYVKWDCDPEKVERDIHLDPNIWQRIKLSEYYAAVEARDEADAGKLQVAP